MEKKETDKIMMGFDMPDNLINVCQKMLEQFDQLRASEIEVLDQIMHKNNKCLSMLDKMARMYIYKHCHIEKIHGTDIIIEQDADDTQEI